GVDRRTEAGGLMWRCSHSRTLRSTLGALAITIALACAAASTLAQSSITGEIRAADTHVPLAGALVAIAGSSTIAETGDDGRFTLAPVSGGAHTIVVRRIGYAPGRVEHVVDAGSAGPVVI